MKTMPAGPAVPYFIRREVAQRPPLMVPSSSMDWHLAYCYAQALAASDGHRRRVRKVPHGLWCVEHAALGREVLR